jgi:hypothetical protein
MDFRKNESHRGCASFRSCGADARRWGAIVFPFAISDLTFVIA